MNARLRIWSISWLALVLVSIPAIDARSVGDLVKAGSFDNDPIRIPVVKAASFDSALLAALTTNEHLPFIELA